MRPYRWQDPAPAPVAAIRERRTKRVPINCAQTAPEQPSMVLDGVEYVEAQGRYVCEGCAFIRRNGCGIGTIGGALADEAFGGSCEQRSVIYIRKA